MYCVRSVHDVLCQVCARCIVSGLCTVYCVMSVHGVLCQVCARCIVSCLCTVYCVRSVHDVLSSVPAMYRTSDMYRQLTMWFERLELTII